MAGWDDIINELERTPNQIDYVRNSYMNKLSRYTSRNTIAYYSSFLSKQNENQLDVNDLDMNGFMNALKGMDCTKGLDLILHTPGGSPVAAEAIVKYLRKKFKKDIRVIVPQLAMSAGTMIACASKEIIMCRSSSLGPIDPQFNGIPAYSILQEFTEAKNDIASNPQNTNYWAILLNKYPPAFVKRAMEAIDLSSDLVKTWLGTCMFDEKKDEDKIDAIVSKLNEHNDSKEHGRHLDSEFCKSIGLKIKNLEDDSKLQDAVLSVHHIFMITLNNTSACKIIQSQNKKVWIVNSSQ